MVVQLATVAVMATLSMETTLGSVGVMECGVTHHLHAIVRYNYKLATKHMFHHFPLQLLIVIHFLILLMDKWTYHQELPLVVQLPTVAVMATI